VHNSKIFELRWCGVGRARMAGDPWSYLTASLYRLGII
jgi:hypothetical protein